MAPHRSTSARLSDTASERGPDERISADQELDVVHPPAATRADVLSDRSLELAARAEVTIVDAAVSLCAQAEHDRGYLVAAHVIHCRRMARRCTGDNVYSRALEIIEHAMRLVRRPNAQQPQVSADQPRRPRSA